MLDWLDLKYTSKFPSIFLVLQRQNRTLTDSSFKLNVFTSLNYKAKINTSIDKIISGKTRNKNKVWNQCSITWFWSVRLTKMSRSLPKNIWTMSYLFNCLSYNILEFRISNSSWRKVMVLTKTQNRTQRKFLNIWISFSQQTATCLHGIISF